MRDAEFIAGRLDTGFISRFNERRAAAAEAAADAGTDAAETARRDMALIAAALAYAEPARNDSQTQAATAPPSRWKLAGRAALHGSRI